MAYTTPRTWTDGELVTKAIMDVHVRDNFNAMGPHLIVRKTSDQSVTSSTVLVNDSVLVLPVGVSEIWHFTFFVVYTGASTGDIKIAFTFPSGGDIRMSLIGRNAAGTVVDQNFSTTTSPTSSIDFAAAGTTFANTLPLTGVFVNGGTGGNLQMQWAQQTSDATATIVKANSTLWAVKLA